MFGNGSYLPYFNHEGNQGSPFGGMNFNEEIQDNNAYNSYHVTCDLCSGYHVTYECMQAQIWG